jgi:hypothetical protein
MEQPFACPVSPKSSSALLPSLSMIGIGSVRSSSGLLRDAHAAEDVIQEVWLRLEHIADETSTESALIAQLMLETQLPDAP